MRVPSRVTRVLAALFAALFALAVLALSAATTVTRLTGHQLVVVTGGSMDPVLHAGDALLVRHVTGAQLRPGLVVTFRSARGPLTTHRIVALRTVAGQPHLQTRGDANRTPDPDFSPTSAVVGAPVLVLPHGRWLQWLLASERGHLALFGPLLLAVLLHELTVLRARRTALPSWRLRTNPPDQLPVTGLSPTATAPPPAPARSGCAVGGSSTDRGSAPAGLLLAVAALSVLVGAGAPALSGATLLDAAGSTGNSFSTARLAPPTNLAASSSSTGVNLTWTATASTAATGYQVLRGTASGGPYTLTATISSAATTSYTDSTASGTSFYVLRSTAAGWTSPDSNEVSAGTTTTTPLASCTSQQADTGGNNNGYELSPSSGCARDGATAQDAKSGTTRVVSCTDAGKDRHRFWNYNLAVPSTAKAVTGLQVDLTANVSTNNGTGQVCVQLSGDGGATWTTSKSTTVTTTLTTYQLGSSTDLWGSSWTPSQLNNTNFRVRVIDVDDTGNKSFSLDGLGLRATYTN